MKTIRIATVTATGHRFLVNSIDFRSEKALLWGQVTAARGVNTTHEKAFYVALAEVTITEEPKTEQLVRALWLQYHDSLRAKGHEVWLSGRKNLTAHVVKAR